MPEVYDKKGNKLKEFAYTKSGMAAARRYAAQVKGRVEIEHKEEMAKKMKRKREYM
jgi:hypothetical protein